MDAGLLIARMVFGLLMAIHGSQKLFGLFGGSGMNASAAFLEQLGFRPGRLFLVGNVLTECGGGVLLALGLVQPAAAALIVSSMVVAIATVHWRNGLLAITNGIELPFLYLTAALSLALTGPGAYSLDAVLGFTELWTPQITALILCAGVVGALASLTIRRTAPAIAHASSAPSRL